MEKRRLFEKLFNRNKKGSEQNEELQIRNDLTEQQENINSEIEEVITSSPFDILPTKKLSQKQIEFFQINTSMQVLMQELQYKIRMTQQNTTHENAISILFPIRDLQDINTAFFVYYPEVIQDIKKITDQHSNEIRNTNISIGHLNKLLTQCIEKHFGEENSALYFEDFLRLTLIFIEQSLENNNYMYDFTSNARSINELFNTSNIPKHILELGLNIINSHAFTKLSNSPEDFKDFIHQIGEGKYNHAAQRYLEYALASDFRKFMENSRYVFPNIYQIFFQIHKQNPILYFVYLQKLTNLGYKVPQEMYNNAQDNFTTYIQNNFSQSVFSKLIERKSNEIE